MKKAKAEPQGSASRKAPEKKSKSVSYDPKPEAITTGQYRTFQEAYDFMNKNLFDGELPNVMVVLSRKANTRGWFAPNRFAGRGTAAAAHELAMNPDAFADRTDEQIISTLAHEMVHVWQQTHGTPPRRCYHDQQWANKMKAIGLQPTDTGESGGKETGTRVTHLINPDGDFHAAYAQLAASGFALQWQSMPRPPEAAAKAASKTKFTCPGCEQNAWGKPDTSLICGTCWNEEDPGEVQFMEAA